MIQDVGGSLRYVHRGGYRPGSHKIQEKGRGRGRYRVGVVLVSKAQVIQ